jgi:nucleotide-binding universal stress UspA family protein
MAPYVKEMVEHFSANLTLVHAYGLDALARTELEITRPELPEKAHVLEEQRLREFALATFTSWHVESFAEFGEPGRIIHQVVNRQGTDLVMMPTHGRGPVRRFLLGSVAAKVLHDVSAAVWTGTGSLFEGHTPKLPYQSVLCAVDEGDEAKAVLKAGAALACSYKARLSIVHVLETPLANPETGFYPYSKDLTAAADFKLRELKGELGIDAPHTVIDAFVAEGIREEAVRRSADLIVTGRGRAQATFRMWSRLYPIIRQSPCPVLSI